MMIFYLDSEFSPQRMMRAEEEEDSSDEEE